MKLCLPFLICLLSSALFAQTDYKLIFSTGFTTTSVLDKGMSPLIYSGYSVSPGIALERTKPRSISYYGFHNNIGSVWPDINPDLTNANAAYLRFDLDVMHVRLITTIKDKFPFYLGGSFSNYANARIHTAYSNNSINYEFVSSLNINGLIAKDIIIRKRNTQLQWQLMLPVIAFVQRPGFAFAAPHYYMEEDRSRVGAYLKSGNLTSWNDYFRLNSKFNFTYFLKNSNAFRLSYEWDFYRYNEEPINKMQLGEHSVTISLIFDL